jgi:hypothetical protein
MKKPTATAILAAPPLSAHVFLDKLSVCNVCAKPSEKLGAHRAHDERDRPIAGHRALVFIGDDHAECLKRMEDHPRLFDRVNGNPGHFPRLCGPCVHRKGMACTHKDLKANGGPGLLIKLAGMNAIICSRGAGCRSMIGDALECAGRETKE